MNKNEKIFIENNQEDEDGFNLNPGLSIITETIRNVPAREHWNNSENNSAGIVKTKAGTFWVSSSLSAKK